MQICVAFLLGSEIQTLQHELPELQKRLAKTEADLLKALEGEKKASEEVSSFTMWTIRGHES